MVEPWTVVGSTVTYEDRWLKVRSDRCRTPAGRAIEPFHVLEFPTWVNVVALTEARELVLCREYRHGAGRVIAGLPSGAMDPSDADPEAAARRELREETGFEGGRWLALGGHWANPANQTNRACAFLGVEVRPGPGRRDDPDEPIEVVRLAAAPFFERLWRGDAELQVSHVAALQAAAHALMTGRIPAPAGLAAALRAAYLGPA